jgi:hypothetical protein
MAAPTMRGPGILLLLVFVATGPARAAGPDLGPLERGSVDAALAARGLTTDPSPDGKRVGQIHVFNLDVFQPADGGLLVWANHFHRTTRDNQIRRESLLQPGMIYDPLLVDETLRTLRSQQPYQNARSQQPDLPSDPPVTGIAAMVPVVASMPDTVDLLVVTRDVWSLRFNTGYNYQPGYLINLTTSLSENNLFGWRKQVALEYDLQPGYMMAGPNYFDPNVLGTHLRLVAAFYEIWQRKLGEIAAGPNEGSSGRLRIEYPFYALANRWGGFVDAKNLSYVYRAIQGQTLGLYNPATSKCEFLDATAAPNPDAGCAYRLHSASIKSGLTRAVPRSWLIQRFTVGNEFGLTRPSFLGTFPAELRDSFAASAYWPASERTSLLYAQYDAFTPRYRVYRNLDTYDLGEGMRLGPNLTLKLGRASPLLGSERAFYTFLTKASVNLDLGGGFQSIGASWESRHYSEGWLDQTIKASLYAATPMLAGVFRIVGSGLVGLMPEHVHHVPVAIGALEGIRGYPVNAFYGYDYYTAHLELRTTGAPVWSVRLGGLLFADAGHAADTWSELMVYSDVGAGVRLLIPQLNVEPIRCDWAFPMRTYRNPGGAALNAGWPGRVSCGFYQAF